MKNTTEQMPSIKAKEDITIEIATKPAYRLWQGRQKNEKKHGILGLPGFCKLMRGVEQSIKEDDPYADYYYLLIEEAIERLIFDLNIELKDIESLVSENIPSAMNMPDVGSSNPIVIPVRFASSVGFKMVYQLLKVDQIVLKILLANHIGLLPTKDKFQTIARVERRFRSVMHLIFGYRHTGVTRDDIAANNPIAKKAQDLMGDLDACYLEATKRSDNAPSLPLKRLRVIGK